jgi:hypothetical protein
MQGLQLARNARIDMGRQLNAVPLPLVQIELGVTRQRIYQLVNEGSLEIVKCGSFSFITNKSLANFKLIRAIDIAEKQIRREEMNRTKNKRGRPRKNTNE